jgi:hypothetical protein
MAIDWDKHVLAPMMSSDVFGEDVQPTFLPAAGGSFPLDGVFDRAYKGLVIDADGEPEIATREPVIGVRLSQFPQEPLQGDRILIPSVGLTFMVSNVEPDGKGWAMLRLVRT